MNRFTIYCTEGQTCKALELGAPIELESEYYNPTENDFKLDNPIPCESFTNGYHYAKCPTADQMIGWLEEQPSIVTIGVNKSRCLKWEYFITKIGYNEIDSAYNYSSRKEATIAAIDAALEYLSINKKVIMKNIFKDAYFDKPYRTRDGKKAIYTMMSCGSHWLSVQDTSFTWEYDDSGKLVSEICPAMDIVSEWKEPIDVEKIDMFASEYIKDKKKPSMRISSYNGFRACFRKAIDRIFS